jgi:hypothetical protein
MRRVLLVGLLGLIIVPFAWASVFPGKAAVPYSKQVGCGVERWGVKTLTDPLAGKVVFAPKDTTIRALRGRRSPGGVRGLGRLLGVETRTFRVRVALVEMKLEPDSDIHVVIADPRNSRLTMIAEFPHPSCTAGASPQARAKMRRARNSLVSACGSPSSSFARLTGRATISGVGFFDEIHGQKGVAPNGIELHPAVGLTQLTCRRAGAPPPPPPPPPGGPPPPPSGNCHASYPTVCIPPPPPDLNCADVQARNFRVRWDVPDPDPHHFDGNRDGVGCEG